MDSSSLKLTIVSQEEELLSTEADSITAPASEGEVTILPKHISLFTRLTPGELVFRSNGEEDSFVVSKGFMDVNINNTVTVMVDTAVAARDISLQKAEEAVRQAKETMSNSSDRQELIMAEASLRKALLEIKVAQKTKKSQI